MNSYLRFLSRSVIVLALAGAACLVFAQGQPATTKLTKRVVGDYGYWSRTQRPPYAAAQIPMSKLTHINHAGVSFDSSANLVVPAGFLEPELIEKAHNAGVRVMLLLGGDFESLVTTPSLVQILVNNLSVFLNRHGYDGVDIDWEYPASDQDAATFFSLFSALRGTLPAPTFVLSADVAPWGGSGYNFSKVTPLVDYFNIMMYDCAGPWTDDAQLNSAIFPDPFNPATYNCEPGGTVKETIDIYVKDLAIPAHQLNMGTPFYGYLYQNVSALWGYCTDCGNTVISENYGTFIKQRINQQGWRTLYDTYSLVPYMLRTDGKPGFITYDDAFSTFYRVSYSVWQRGLGGSFMWSLDADYDGQSQDLLEAMYNASLPQTK